MDIRGSCFLLVFLLFLVGCSDGVTSSRPVFSNNPENVETWILDLSKVRYMGVAELDEEFGLPGVALAFDDRGEMLWQSRSYYLSDAVKLKFYLNLKNSVLVITKIVIVFRVGFELYGDIFDVCGYGFVFYQEFDGLWDTCVFKVN